MIHDIDEALLRAATRSNLLHQATTTSPPPEKNVFHKFKIIVWKYTINENK